MIRQKVLKLLFGVAPKRTQGRVEVAPPPDYEGAFGNDVGRGRKGDSSIILWQWGWGDRLKYRSFFLRQTYTKVYPSPIAIK